MDKNEAKEIVKQAVFEAIEYCGTQVSLANKSQLTQGAIGKYIRGEAMPKGESAKQLHLAVDKTIELNRFAPLIF